MKKILFFLSIFCISFAQEITDIINTGERNLPTISVQDSSSLSDYSLQERINKIVVGDLRVAAVFDVENSYNKIPFDAGIDGSHDFIFRYEFINETSGIKLNAKTFDGKNKSVVFEGSYSSKNPKQYPFLIHLAISEMSKKVGFSNVDWMKEPIIFSRYTSAKTSEILIADYTLNYQQILVKKGLSIFPKWANATKTQFFYTGYVDNTPVLFRHDIASGKSTRIFVGKGMLIASDVNKNGDKVLITNAPEEQSEIYLLDLKTKNATRITKYGGIDVNGNFVNDESAIAFVSDRLGYPNIFFANIDGSGAVTQLVYHGKNNSSLTTNKNFIAYSSRESSGDFNIYLMSTQSNFIRQLTNGGKNSFPRFSTDGGSILYIKEVAGQSAVGIIRVNENKSFYFPLNIGKIQSLDW